MLKKYLVEIILGVFFGAVFTYLTLRQVNLNNFLKLMQSVNCSVLALSGLVYILCYVLRSVRFCFIILPIKKTKLLANFPYTVIGFLINNVLPLRLGEVVRANITGKQMGIPRSSILAAIIIERVFDITTFIFFFFAIIFLVPLTIPKFLLKSFGVLLSIVILCIIVLPVVITLQKKTLKIIRNFAFVPTKVKRFICLIFSKFINGLSVLKKPSIVFKVFVLSLLIWLAESFFFLAVASSCGVSVSILGAAFTIIVVGIGTIIPTTPGLLGTFEFMGITALQILSIDKDPALASIVTYHLLEILLIVLLGVLCILKAKVTFSDLLKFSKSKEHSA
ncbi:MAG: flippase-like domain-containing protein [Elusimicrobiota bacterium]|jgi:uncharacterized protein (TIRG00374 family)|nr:flippase-like domain-containing protein [Elusimicrobiota bacterium]